MNNTIYLLTGASGLLGGNILKILTERGERVRVLVRNNFQRDKFPRAEAVSGDLLDTESLRLFFSVPEDLDIIVIHSAGIVTMDPKPDQRTHDVNVRGTANIITNCIDNKVRKLVYISSTSVIPEPPMGEKIREAAACDPDRVVGYYSKTKAEATQLVFDAVREQGLDASVIYPSGILGPNDYGSGLITSSLKMVAGGKLRVAVGGTFNSVDARDLAQGVIACAEKGRRAESYIMAGQCQTFTHFLETVCGEVGVGRPLFTIPLWVLRPFTGLGVLYGKLTRRPPWFSGYTIYNLERNNDFSSEKASRELGFHSRAMNETIKDTIAWMRDEKMIKSV